ncbi:MAG: hypothetical protein IPM29_07545 [Planctomycetes bacterium]|nr:hypothetical protein [Planctomycetota bacterium]
METRPTFDRTPVVGFPHVAALILAVTMTAAMAMAGAVALQQGPPGEGYANGSYVGQGPVWLVEGSLDFRVADLGTGTWASRLTQWPFRSPPRTCSWQ